MATAKLDLNGAPVPERIQKLRTVVSAMTDNPNFTGPLPTLAALSAAIDALETSAQEAQQARDLARARTAAQNTADEGLMLLASSLVGYVDAASEGDVEKILSAGMGVRNRASKPRELTAPIMAGSQTTQIPGELELRWSPVAGARTYLIERTTDALGSTGWTNGDSATKTKVILKGLERGIRYSFRVAAVGPLGTGPWSEAIVRLM